MQPDSNLMGMLVFSIIILAVIGLIIKQALKKHKRPSHIKESWGVRLRNQFITPEQMEQMYEDSRTFGMCATGELFGALDRLLDQLPRADFNIVFLIHKKFGQSIALMHLYFEQEDRQDFEAARAEALHAWGLMKAFKKTMELQYVKPSIMPSETERGFDPGLRVVSSIIAIVLTAALLWSCSGAEAAPAPAPDEWTTNVFTVNGCEMWYIHHATPGTFEAAILHSPQCKNWDKHSRVPVGNR